MSFYQNRLKFDYLSLLNMAVTVILFLSVITPVSAKEILAESQSLSELITNLITNVGEAVDQNISNKDGFMTDFAEWYSDTGGRLEDVLEDMGLIIKDYAESEAEFDQQYLDLINNSEAFQGELEDLILTYPQLSEIIQIVSPHVFEFEDVLKSEYPMIGPAPQSGNPLSHVFNYFNDTAAQDPLETGSFFRIEFLRDSLNIATFQEQVIERTVAGVKQKTVVFRETNEFENSILIFHEIIVDDEVVEFSKRLEDFSVLHGLPSQMRADGVNENVVLYVEEMLNLINLNLAKAFDEEGLEIPIDHPQLAVPAGYNNDVFVSNFNDILEDLAEDFS